MKNIHRSWMRVGKHFFYFVTVTIYFVMCIDGIFLPQNSNYPLSLPACTIKKQGPAEVFNPTASSAWKAHPWVFVLSFHTFCILISEYTQDRCVVSGQLHASNSSWYPLDRRLTGLQSQSGCCGDQDNPSPLQGRECCFPSRPVLTIITAPTELYRLSDNTKHSPFQISDALHLKLSITGFRGLRHVLFSTFRYLKRWFECY
jgi:hypothetical protein